VCRNAWNVTSGQKSAHAADTALGESGLPSMVANSRPSSLRRDRAATRRPCDEPWIAQFFGFAASGLFVTAVIGRKYRRDGRSSGHCALARVVALVRVFLALALRIALLLRGPWLAFLDILFCFALRPVFF
jgi:hypothetical protein